MDMQNFGRDLVDILAKRSLEMLRDAKMSDVREVVSGRILQRESSGMGAGTMIGALLVGAAVGAGITAFLTPTSGPELRKRVVKTTNKARKQAMQMGDSVVRDIEHQAHTLVENASTAIGLASPAPAKRKANGHAHANGHATNGHARKARQHAHA
jgi:gas vesicle protein